MSRSHMYAARAACLLGLLLVGLSGGVSAQVRAADTTRAVNPANPVVPVDAVALDAPVDRQTYLLGPGDGLDLAILGDLTNLFSLVVTPEGSVVIPGVGVTQVLGLNLDEAQQRISDLVLRYYRNISVRLTLSRVRQIKVFVLGDVPDPGVRVATAATRLSEVLASDGGGNAYRNVTLRRASGDSVSIDLVRFQRTGDLRLNPRLREGDVIILPRGLGSVVLNGRVQYPGSYQYRPGETLAALLDLANAGGSFPPDAADTVRVTRFTSPFEREFLRFTRAEAVGPRGRQFVLEPSDAIYIPAVANYKEQQSASVSGEVRFPGTYPIVPGETTVRDLVRLAGGFTPRASLIQATLQRTHRSGAVERDEFAGVPPELLTEQERMISRIRSSGSAAGVVIDFDRVFAEGGAAYDQPLEADDHLTIPELQNEITVLGAVAQPGIVQFTPGRGVRHFVDLAGGYSRLASTGRVVVLKARLGTRISAKDATSLEPGDQIIVPYRERRTFGEVAANVQSVLGAVSSLALTILALNRIF